MVGTVFSLLLAGYWLGFGSVFYCGSQEHCSSACNLRLEGCPILQIAVQVYPLKFAACCFNMFAWYPVRNVLQLFAAVTQLSIMVQFLHFESC